MQREKVSFGEESPDFLVRYYTSILSEIARYSPELRQQGFYLPATVIESAWLAYQWRKIVADHMILLGITTSDSSKPSLSREKTSAMAEALRRAEIVIWSSQMRQAAVSGYQLFINKEFPIDLMPKDRFVLWLLENPTACVGEYGFPPWYTSQAVLFVPPQSERGDLVAYSILLPDTKLFPSSLDELRLKYPDWADGTPDTPFVRGSKVAVDGMTIPAGYLSQDRGDTARLAAMFSFMHLPLVVAREERLSRPERRRLTRDGVEQPLIKSVQLRRTYEDRPAAGESERDWQCRWIVRGHWRNQWYPSEQTHHPVFIVPYVKGPESKPLRLGEKPELIYKVVR